MYIYEPQASSVSGSTSCTSSAIYLLIYEKEAENELKGIYACICIRVYTGVYVCNMSMCMYIYEGIYVGIYVCYIRMYICWYICM